MAHCINCGASKQLYSVTQLRIILPQLFLSIGWKKERYLCADCAHYKAFAWIDAKHEVAIRLERD